MMKHFLARLLVPFAAFALLAFTLLARALAPAHAQSTAKLVMFDDAEQSGWFSHQDSFATTTEVFRSGWRAISFPAPNKGYQFTLDWERSFTSIPFERLEFYIHGGAQGGQSFTVTGQLRDLWRNSFKNAKSVALPNAGGKYLEGGLATLPPNRWVKVSIPLQDLGVARRVDFRGVEIKVGEKAGFFIDDISLVGTVPARATISVNATQTVRRVNDNIFGISTYGTPRVNNPLEVEAARDAGYRLHRAFYPTFGVHSGLSNGLPFAEATGAEAIGAVLWIDWPDYDNQKPGTPEQAAAMVAWANVPMNAPAALLDLKLGVDERGRDWGTVRKWVRMRAVENKAPGDDPFNPLRIKHPKPFGVKLWELDNEPWLRTGEADWLGYANFCKKADALMKRVDPTIKTGVTLIGGDGNPGKVKREITNPANGQKHTGFSEVTMFYLSGRDQALSPGKLLPDFIVCHNYAGTNGGPSANLANLFTYQQRDGGDWESIARMYRRYLTDYYGEDGKKPYFIVTENNIAATFPLTRQTTSLPHALYVADDLGMLLQSKPGDFEGLTWHDWDDGPLEKGSYAENPQLYGWRIEAGYGIYRDGTRTRYPAHYAFKLLSRHFAFDGDSVVAARTSTPYLQPYAVRQQNGNLAVLLVNKAAQQNIVATFNIQGYRPGAIATLYRWGKIEDRNEADITPSTISYKAGQPLVLPAYSLTVVTFTQMGGRRKPPAPTMLYARAGNGQARLHWTAMSGATSYDVYRAVANGSFTPLKTRWKSNTFTDAKLQNGTKYSYRVAARGNGGTSAPSMTVSVAPVAPPGAVTNLSVVAADGQATLSWSPVAQATDYTVQRATKAKGPFSTLTTHAYKRLYNGALSFSTHNDRNLQNGTKYFYRVLATNPGGSGPAALVSATPRAVPTPWRTRDIAGRDDGSTRLDPATGKWTLEGSGPAWYGAGQGRFVYQKLSGDGSITARVLSGKAGLYEKNTFGVMLRDTVTPGQPARWTLMALTPINPDNGSTQGHSFMSYGGGDDKLHFQSDVEGDNAKRSKAPAWVRLTRSGDKVSGAVSPNGQSWRDVGSTTLKDLPQDVYVGLIANSMVYYATLRGEFDKVQVSGATAR